MAKWQSDHKSEATKAGIARKRLEGKGKRGKDKKKRVRRWLKRPRISTSEFQE
jgi:DNA invertase Pin-like site-specific DNA recombinase